MIKDKKEATMGLSDILTGMMNGPHGQRQPSSGASGGGMSPVMMALLGLLAHKAFKGRAAQGSDPGTPARPAAPGGTARAGTPGGGLDDILGGLFGGKPASTPGATTTSGKPSSVPGAGAQPGGSPSDLFPGG